MKAVRTGLCAAAAWLALQAPAMAQDNDSISYTMARGDTLIALAGKYFRGSNAVGEVMRINNIRDPRRIPVGTVLTVPRALLKFEELPMQVRKVSGDVTIARDGKRAQTPIESQRIGENTIVRTGRGGFITLGSVRNSRVSLPSSSTVRINSARRYLINNEIDFDIRVLDGRGTIRAPKLEGGERFNVGTPRAVTAVRGTEFRVGFDEASEGSITEVLEGNVQVSAGSATTPVGEGVGIASSGDALGNVEQLLVAPELVDAGKTQTGETLIFKANPLEGAKAYRTLIARDQTFEEVVAEIVTTSPEIELSGLADQRYVIRTRGIAENGLEGFEDEASFRRKRIGASAQAEQPFADAFKFIWGAEGEGKSYAAFRLWNAADPDTLIVDGVGLENKGLYVSDLPNGTYKWQVATFQIIEAETDPETGKRYDAEVIKIWSEPAEFTVSD